MDKNNKKQEEEYLHWILGIRLGIVGSILGSFLVSSFFIIYEKFDCSLESVPKLETILFTVSFCALIFLYFKNKSKIDNISNNLTQEKLNKELEKGRLKSALKILERDPSLSLNISKAIDIILNQKKDPLVFMEEYKKIKEIDLSTYSSNECKDFLIHEKGFLNNEGIGSAIVIERFFNNDYAEPFDDNFWKKFSSSIISIGDFFESANGYHTTSLLLYCLISNITKQPIVEFSMEGDYSNQRKGLNTLIELINKNSFIKNEIKTILQEIKELNNTKEHVS